MVLSKVVRRLKVYFALLNAKRDTRRRLARDGIRNILVLCYGNIYRSPFVESFLSQRLPSDFMVRSAGFFPRAGRTSTDQHIKMAADYGVDLSRHLSSVVDEQMVAWADVIVIMDRHNWVDLSKFGSAATKKAVWLGAVLDKNAVEIADPYNRGPAEAQMIVLQLLEASETMFRALAHN